FCIYDVCRPCRSESEPRTPALSLLVATGLRPGDAPAFEQVGGGAQGEPTRLLAPLSGPGLPARQPLLGKQVVVAAGQGPPPTEEPRHASALLDLVLPRIHPVLAGHDVLPSDASTPSHTLCPLLRPRSVPLGKQCLVFLASDHIELAIGIAPLLL